MSSHNVSTTLTTAGDHRLGCHVEGVPLLSHNVSTTLTATGDRGVNNLDNAGETTRLLWHGVADGKKPACTADMVKSN